MFLKQWTKSVGSVFLGTKRKESSSSSTGFAGAADPSFKGDGEDGSSCESQAQGAVPYTWRGKSQQVVLNSKKASMKWYQLTWSESWFAHPPKPERLAQWLARHPRHINVQVRHPSCRIAV